MVAAVQKLRIQFNTMELDEPSARYARHPRSITQMTHV
jgi:hypothetical protein